MKLRQYQQLGHDSIIEAFKKYRSTLLVQGTGTGKTVVFAHVIKTIQPGRALVLAHRNELIWQAKEKIEAVTGLPVEIEKANMSAGTNLFTRTPIVVGSIQTQISGSKGKRRYMRFKPEEFSLLVVDEAHHCTSASWKEVVAYYQRNPNLKLLGVTATPKRADEEALSQLFESVAFEYGILTAIQDGYLVDIAQQFVSVSGLDYSHVKTTAGDLNEGDLAKVMEMEENVQGVCQPSLEVMFGLPPKTLKQIPVPQWREYLSGLNRRPRRTIVFTVSVAQAEMYADVFSRAMPGVEWVCGKTSPDKRKSTLDRFALGETHVVANCGVLLEGFDNPGVEVIVMARPTKSQVLYSQCIGRSTRPLPGVVDGVETPELRRAAIAGSAKPLARILDFVGNSGHHKLVTCVDVLGGKITEEARQAAKQKAVKDGKPVRILVTMTNAEVELEKQKREAAEKARQREAARKAHLLASVNYHSQNVNPFDSKDIMPTGNSKFSKDGRQFSEPELRILRTKLGCSPEKLSFRQGKAIIADYFSKPTKAQAYFLTQKGFNPKYYDLRSASAMIDQIKNGTAPAATVENPF